MPNAGGKPRAVLTVALTLTGRKVVGTAGTGEKVDVRPIPSEVVVGMSALETEIETEIEIGAETAIGDAESDAPTASRMTAAGLTPVRAPTRGPVTGPSMRSAAVTGRASVGTPGGALTRSSGPRKPSRQGWALGNQSRRLTSRGP